MKDLTRGLPALKRVSTSAGEVMTRGGAGGGKERQPQSNSSTATQTRCHRFKGRSPLLLIPGP